MRRVEIAEEGPRLIVTRSREGAALDILPLALMFLFPALPVTLFLRAADDFRGPKAVLAVALVTAVLVLIVAGFLLALRQYRRRRLDGRLVLDRATRSVVQGAEVKAAFADVARVDLSRAPGPGSPARFDMVLVLAGGPLAVRGTADREEMRGLARRVADCLGVPLAEAD